jgi:site-specific DNA-methyltransferase (adenine-specific)
MQRVINDDCFNVFSTLADNCIDAIITDPPYGVLTGHKIETNVDIPRLASECFRVLKPDSPMVFFGLMPKSLVWLNEFTRLFNFRSEVIWCKRQSASFMLPIPRIHESIYIMSKGKMVYNKIKGVYEDIKMPMYLDGLLSQDSILDKEQRVDTYCDVKRNDTYLNNIALGFSKQNPNGFVRNVTAKFQSVWSFTPFNQLTHSDLEHNIKHPTVKPLLLMDRLIELTTFEGQTILDPFAGSGSTLLSAKRLKRNFIGIEIDKDYYDIIQYRLNQPFEAKLF